MPANVEDILELTPLQHGMLFHSVLEPEAGLYFEQICFPLPVAIDRPRFEEAWQMLAARHQILRASFVWKKLERPVQVIHRHGSIPVHSEDWSAHSPAEQERRLRAYLEADRKQGVALDTGPLFRVALFRFAPHVHQLVSSFHHAILDGWSINLLFSELLQIYSALVRETVPELPPAPACRDYIAWLQRQDIAAAEGFWRPLLAGYAGPAQAPPRPRGEFGECQRPVSGDLSTRLTALARQRKVTMATLVQAAWAMLLALRGGEEDVVFGSVVSGRPPNLEGVERMVGLFINTVPVRVRLDSSRACADLLVELNRQQLDSRQFDYCSLVQIQGWSEVPRGQPLFDTLLIFENLPGSGRGSSPILPHAIERTNYPLTLLVAPGPPMSLKLLFSSPGCDRDEAELILATLEGFLEAIADEPDRRVGSLSSLSETERRFVLREVNATGRDLPPKRIEEEFEARATAAGERIAVIEPDRAVTFAELHDLSRGLAAELARWGIGSEAVVAILLPPSAARVAAMLGTLMAGGAFLLLDPELPRSRLRYMLEDSGARLVVASDGTLEPVPPGLDVVKFEDVAPVSPSAALKRTPPRSDAALAYLIYTSGSTGRSKAVLQTHRATLNRFRWMWRELPWGAKSIACHKTSPGFVDAIWEMLGSLLGGVPLVIATEEERRDVRALVRRLAEHSVTRLVVVPTLLRQLLEVDDAGRQLKHIREWLCSGEALPADLAERFRQAFPKARLLNLYGTSEVAADVTFHEVTAVDRLRPVPIGHPIDNSQVYLLNRQLQPVPRGFAGEMYVSGDPLARGYHRQPGLTAERFIPDPFSAEAGARMYRTGDRAVRRADGSLNFLGRADRQVKVSGIRIELGEIEATILGCAGVERVAAEALNGADHGGGRIGAAIVATAGTNLDVATLRAELAHALPAAAIPMPLVVADALPSLANGKVDHLGVAALLRSRGLDPATAASLTGYTETERRLAAIWQAILGVPVRGPDSDFFSLGGHSLAAMRLVTGIIREFGVELPLQTVFASPSLADLARAVAEAGAQTRVQAEPQLVRRSRADHVVRDHAG